MEPRYIVFKGGFDVHFLTETTNINTFKCIVQAGARTPMPHYHEHFDETVRGLTGFTTVTLNGRMVEIGPGESILIPRGAVHQIGNKSKETIEFVCDVSPGVFGYGYFRDIADVLNMDGLPDIDRLKAIMKTHGLVPVIGLKQSLVFGVLRVLRQFKK
jgi:quercetin dioxygenase-like cupin family protein